MSTFSDQIQGVKDRWQRLKDSLDSQALRRELELCQEKMSKSEFWRQAEAGSISKRQAYCRQQLDCLERLDEDLRILEEFDQKTSEDGRQTIGELLEDYLQRLQAFEQQCRFNEPYDDYDVIMSIFAGAGGTDAQDWAEMLMRMYWRWTKQKGLTADLLSQAAGEEAGLKSVSFKLSGQPFLYGRLKGEQGVHRLVRISPFNAQNLRQTSFAQVEVLPSLEEPSDLALNEVDLRFDFFKSSGHGGQSVNTTDSAVRVTHLPTQTTVNVQNERSQHQNKVLALTILRSRLKRRQLLEHAQKLSDLKGSTTANEWGSQIRNYVLHPYKQVKDLRTQYVTSEAQKILNGDLDALLQAYVEKNSTFEIQ